MKKVQDAVAVVAFSIAALLCFHLIPDFWPETEFAGIVQYAVMGLSFLYFMAAYRLPTLRFLKRPRFGLVAIFSFGLAVLFVIWRADMDHAVHFSWLVNIEGVIYLLAIGFGEEIVSRGFVFGILEKYGKWRAILFSSFTFGLMHLNVYIGDDWDPYPALIHVISASGFGFLACAVMLSTQSIWPAVVMHGLSDWTVFFKEDPFPDSASDAAAADPWTLGDALFEGCFLLLRTVPLALLIFFSMWLSNRTHESKRFEKLMLRFKLIEVE